MPDLAMCPGKETVDEVELYGDPSVAYDRLE